MGKASMRAEGILSARKVRSGHNGGKARAEKIARICNASARVYPKRSCITAKTGQNRDAHFFWSRGFIFSPLAIRPFDL